MRELGGGDADIVLSVGIGVVGEGGAAALEFEGEVLHPGCVLFAIVVAVETTGFG